MTNSLVVTPEEQATAMGHYEIRKNTQGKPYVIEENFGYDPESTGSSSHWTWQITDRGVRHLCKSLFGIED